MESAEKLCNNNNNNNNVMSDMANTKSTNLENNIIRSECLKRTLDGLVNDSTVKDEKVDVSPEISNKSPNSNNGELEKVSAGGNAMNKSFSMYTFGNNNNNCDDTDTSESPSKSLDPSRATAFVIDFSGGKQIDEQRHKKILERFQKNRHRRGVSLSKMDDEMNDSSSSSQLTAKLKSSPSTNTKQTRKLSDSSSTSQQQKPTSASGVRLRERSKASQVRDASKRHSWSPRTSMVESSSNVMQQQPKQQQAKAVNNKNSNLTNPLERPLKLHALTKADVKPMPPTTLNVTALRCLQPPLENRESHLQNDDQVSEAGTYTLDGDNYTEEQKAKMNIDNNYNKNNSSNIDNESDVELLQRQLVINESDSNIETDLEVIDLDPSPTQTPMIRKATTQSNRKNILEVSFYHQEQQPTTSNAKTKTSYLEKLKTKVKSSLHKSKSPESDVGKFTSVTTSGVLSIKPSLEINPNFKRKNSLTKSQIDSSEYVQGRLRKSDVKAPITDNDKTSIASAYQLNIFPSKQSPAKSRLESVGSSSTSISTAATKDDWIQEWARNAREYSRHKRTPATIMSNSFNIESNRESRDDQFGFFTDDAMSKSDCKPQYEEFGDNLEKYNNQKIHHQKIKSANDSVGGNILSSNQSSVSSAHGRKILREFDPNKDDTRLIGATNFNIKPPISPCRIPSPIGSVSHRKKRYGSNAMLYGSETDLANDTDLYLQRTAAAISTLQNLQRKNSIRNSSLQNSPVSPLSPTRPPPAQPIVVQLNRITTTQQPVVRSQSVTRSSSSAVHKRNSSLDSTRFTTPIVMSTSLQTNHLAQAMAIEKQQHSRHNSYEGMRGNSSKFAMQFDQTDDDDEYESMPQNRVRGLSERPHLSIKQQHNLNKQMQSSPIKRSSSFNVKPMEISSPARKVSNNNMKTFSVTSTNGNRIQKSASSSCFKQISRNNNDDDDDYENEFYINDDDNLHHPNQFSPSECSEEEQQKLSLNETTTTTPLNTRYVNKTFLMRCEQNKKAAVGGLKAVGAVACPNTPEMPRRNVSERLSGRDRSSVPRDTSLNRVMEKKLPLSTNSTPTAKSSLTTTTSTGSGRVTSKYLDISKYKSDRSNNFLKRDESKNYLNREVKKSSSSACLQSFQRDTTRTSQRSASSRPSSATTVGSKKKDVKNNVKEAELAMWKRRASYDPMKAAAEGKKKAEEAKKMLQQQQMMMSSESNSSAMRSSKSYHAGTGNSWINDDTDSEYDDEN